MKDDLMHQREEDLTESLESYLHAIYQLEQNRRLVHAKEISQLLSVSLPSVSVALRTLAKKGFIRHEPYSAVILTELGQRIGRSLEERRRALSNFFEQVLRLDGIDAEKVASSLKHRVTDEVIDRLKALDQYLSSCEGRNIAWNELKGFHCEHPEGQNGSNGCSYCS